MCLQDFGVQDLLGENFRRQMLMDGQYGSITFICTKTDVIQVHFPATVSSVSAMLADNFAFADPLAPVHHPKCMNIQLM